jgi:hypothetical protein
MSKQPPRPRVQERTIERASLPTSNGAIDKNQPIADIWQKQRENQKENTLPIAPKGLIYGDRWTGKTHLGCSAFRQGEFKSNIYNIKSFSPCRIIDCNYSATEIAMKDFNKEFLDGTITIIDANKDLITKEPLTDPIKRVENVRNLITACSSFTDGCLVIDGFDSIEKDCMFYIYRQFGFFVKPDGTLWKKASTSYQNGNQVTEPEHEQKGIVQRMYAPRNEQLRDILKKILNLSIPVLIIAHAEEEYKNEKPTGKIISNLRNFIEDDMTFIVYVENVKEVYETQKAGIKQLDEVDRRKIYIQKNRYQKGSTPKVLVDTKDSFEFDDIFRLIMNGEQNNG